MKKLTGGLAVILGALSLSSWAQEGTNSAAAPRTEAERVPRYLELARELVATVKPENNRYEFRGPEGVHWKGDLFTSENSVQTACGPFVHAVFERADNPTLKEVKSHINFFGRVKYVRITDWSEAVRRGWGLKQTSFKDSKPGDLFIYTCNDKCSTVEGDTPGHVAIVDAKPQMKPPTPPIIDGTEQWLITVIDSEDFAHDRNDTRWRPKGEPKITGVGRGTYRVYVDANGATVGYTDGPNGPKLHSHDARPIIMGRPLTNVAN